MPDNPIVAPVAFISPVSSTGDTLRRLPPPTYETPPKVIVPSPVQRRIGSPSKSNKTAKKGLILSVLNYVFNAFVISLAILTYL
jgi:hypothetical protein